MNNKNNKHMTEGKEFKECLKQIQQTTNAHYKQNNDSAQ